MTRFFTTLQAAGASVALVGILAHGITGNGTGVAKSATLLALITLTYLRATMPDEE